MQTTNQRSTLFRYRLSDLFWLILSASVMMAVGTIPNEMLYDYGSFLKAYTILGSIYLFRAASITRQVPRRQRLIAYCLVLLALLPFVYFFLDLFNLPFRFPMNKWAGDPIWLFTVPTISLIAFDFARPPTKPKRFLIRSAVELIIVFPIWTVLWIYLQFAITDCFIR